jgi:hypothetical protein
MTHAVGNVVGPVDAWLNGEQVFEQVNTKASGYSRLQGGAEVEIGSLLKRRGENTLIFTTGPNGFHGEVDIQMRPAPTEQIEVTGTWQVQHDADSGLSTVELPGELNGMFATTSVDVPADWEGDRVFVDLAVTGSYNAFAVNEKMVFHPVNWGNTGVTYMDVTPWVTFGEPNRLTLVTLAATRSWEPGQIDVRKVLVQRVKQAR